VNAGEAIRKAFDPLPALQKTHVDMRFLSETAQFIEVEVKHRTTGTYLCIVECDYKDDVLEARLLQAQNQSGEYATRSVYISLQSAIDKMHDVIFLEMVQGE
jgi:hypothetical protein